MGSKSRAGILLFVAILLLAVPSRSGDDKIRSLCEISYPSDSRIEWQCLKLKWSDTPSGLFGARWQDVLRFNRMDRRHFLGGVSIKVPKNLERIKNFTPLPLTYPDAAREPRFILVDQGEMFLGAYQYGRLALSFPIAIGTEGFRVPLGTFRIDAADRRHTSNLYRVEEIGRPYPMHYGLRFFVDKSKKSWPTYWIHGRDLPGYPASHGCIGLYDEEMQNEYYAGHDRKVHQENYHPLTEPYLQGAKLLYKWVVDPRTDPGSFHEIENGPKVLILGRPPK
jgi:L,D-transpeptidase-like protein